MGDVELGSLSSAIDYSFKTRCPVFRTKSIMLLLPDSMFLGFKFQHPIFTCEGALNSVDPLIARTLGLVS